MIFVKKNGRSSFRSGRRSNYSKNNYSKNTYSSTKPRVKGNITQQHSKYFKLAKEASSSGDRIQSEYFNQFADHYSRLMIEYDIKSYVNEKTNNESASDDLIQENEENEVKEIVVEKNELSQDDNSINEMEDTDNSIEAVPFIAKDVKKAIKSNK